MTNITIKTIPHADQRYDTVGDWWIAQNGDLEIRVSSMGNEYFEALVGFHELAEALLCRARGISDWVVDEFDKAFEANRPEGTLDEPGNHPDAPYRKEHFFATTIERMLGAEFGVDWIEYDEAVMSLQMTNEEA